MLTAYREVLRFLGAPTSLGEASWVRSLWSLVFRMRQAVVKVTPEERTLLDYRHPCSHDPSFWGCQGRPHWGWVGGQIQWSSKSHPQTGAEP